MAASYEKTDNIIKKAEGLSAEQLDTIRKTVGEAFVSNELFHNWGTEAERRDDVLKYMSVYVDYIYRAGELYANEDGTGLIGLEDSAHAPILPRLRMILKLLTAIPYKRMKSFLRFAKQVSRSNERYAKQRHLDVLMVCVDKAHQGKGVAGALIQFAKEKADELGIPLLFDTDMKTYAEMYRHFGCELFKTVTADNSVTRYSLCWNGNAARNDKKEIVSMQALTLRTSGMRGASEYEIVMKSGNAEVSRYGIRYSNGTDERVLEQRAECGEERMLKLLNDCRLLSWDGFDGPHPKGVLDGTMFRLSASVNGGRRILAQGSQNFPKHYRELTDGLYEILTEQQDSRSEPQEAEKKRC